MKETLEQIDHFIESLEASKYVSVSDLSCRAAQYLSKSALEDLERKAEHLFVAEQKVVDGVRQFNVVAHAVYYGLTVRKDRLEVGIQELAKVANELSAKGKIHSVLGGFCYIDLAKVAGRADSVTVLFYPLIKINYLQQAAELPFAMSEGQEPDTLGNLDIDLKDGEFYAEVKVHSFNGLKSAVQESIDANIALYLSILPKGTSLISTTECAISDLSRTVEVKFFNPLFLNVKKVELEMERHATLLNDKVEQFNLLTRVHYLNKEGNYLHTR